mgnify:CR=1 FL=1
MLAPAPLPTACPPLTAPAPFPSYPLSQAGVDLDRKKLVGLAQDMAR